MVKELSVKPDETLDSDDDTFFSAQSSWSDADSGTERPTARKKQTTPTAAKNEARTGTRILGGRKRRHGGVAGARPEQGDNMHLANRGPHGTNSTFRLTRTAHSAANTGHAPDAKSITSADEKAFAVAHGNPEGLGRNAEKPRARTPKPETAWTRRGSGQHSSKAGQQAYDASSTFGLTRKTRLTAKTSRSTDAGSITSTDEREFALAHDNWEDLGRNAGTLTGSRTHATAVQAKGFQPRSSQTHEQSQTSGSSGLVKAMAGLDLTEETQGPARAVREPGDRQHGSGAATTTKTDSVMELSLDLEVCTSISGKACQSFGTYDGRYAERNRLGMKNNPDIEAEHPIPYGSVNNYLPRKHIHGEALAARLPAYLQSKQLHRKHPGTWNNPKSRQYSNGIRVECGWNDDSSYRVDMRNLLIGSDNLLKKNGLSVVYQMNQLGYAHILSDMKAKSIEPNTDYLKTSAKSFNHMITHNPEVRIRTDGGTIGTRLDLVGQAEAILAGKTAITGKWPSSKEKQQVFDQLRDLSLKKHTFAPFSLDDTIKEVRQGVARLALKPAGNKESSRSTHQSDIETQTGSGAGRPLGGRTRDRGANGR